MRHSASARRSRLPLALLVTGLLLGSAVSVEGSAITERLSRAGTRGLCEKSPGLAGWQLGKRQLWNLDAQLRSGANGKPPRAAVVSFFATWCEPCKKGLPMLQQVARRPENRDVAFVLVSVKSPDTASYLAKQGVAMPVVVDKFNTLYEQWWSAAGQPGAGTQRMVLPRTVVVNADRKLVAVFGKEGPDFPRLLQKDLDQAAQRCKN